MRQKKDDKKNVYRLVTDRVIEGLKKGFVPWKKPWNPAHGKDKTFFPENFSTKKKYRGINFFLLLMSTFFEGFSTNSWLTFLQCKKLGGFIKKGSVSTPVCFFNLKEIKVDRHSATEMDKKNWTDEEIKQGFKMKHKSIMRFFNVFNLDQTEGIDKKVNHEPGPVTEEQMIEQAEEIVNGYSDGPEIEYGFNSCFYHPADDKVGVPARSDFDSLESFYCSLYHELSHSTGHPERLNREEAYLNNTEFDSYSFEELVAEMSCCFLSGLAGISDVIFDNSTAYIKGWLKTFENDEKFVMKAASQAQKAADWILNKREYL